MQVDAHQKENSNNHNKKIKEITLSLLFESIFAMNLHIWIILMLILIQLWKCMSDIHSSSMNQM